MSEIYGESLVFAGGGGNIFAYIVVTYSSGATCTCTGNGKTLRAKDTSGKVIFGVNKSGTYTVEAIDGEDSSSKELNITVEGSISEVDLSFDYVAYTTAQSGKTYSENINTLTWGEIKKVAEAISNNNSITASTTGTVYISNGTMINAATSSHVSVGGYDYAVMGFNQYDLVSAGSYSSITASGKTGLTFGAIDCDATTARMNSSGSNIDGWGKPCDMVTTCNHLCPSDLSGYITYASLPYCGTYHSATLSQYETSKFFLPSADEVFSSIERQSWFPKGVEGSQFAYYANSGSKVKKVGSSDSNWWLRSIVNGNTSYFCIVNTGGSPGHDDASFTYGVAPCFCI